MDEREWEQESGGNFLTENRLVRYLAEHQDAQRLANVLAISGAVASILLGLVFYRRASPRV